MSKEEFSDQTILENCPFCDPSHRAYRFFLGETNGFRVVSDGYMLCEGHLLIVPKQHFSCVAEYPPDLFKEFEVLYSKVSDFLNLNYGSVATFEHGIWGQSVYHSHTHLLPFSGGPEKIAPEDKLRKIAGWSEVKESFQKDGGYLFFSIASDQWLVNKELVAPRLLRDKFAAALSRPERGDWKKMHYEKELMEKVDEEATRTKEAWNKNNVL